MLSTNVVMCPVCGHAGELGNGPGGRPRASCRKCGSLERHRALSGILGGLDAAAAAGVLLDVAPTPLMSNRLKAMADDADVPYIGLDFDPSADTRVVTVQASLTDLPLPDASVGLMICFHVLEHIPDDHAAMQEIRRSLAPGGVAVVQVPHRPDQLTDEDPSASVEERLRRFGQADHVRYYGQDFEARLTRAGLHVTHLQMGDLYRGLECDLFGVAAQESVWLCTTGAPIDVAALAEQCATAARASAMHSLEQVIEGRDTHQEARRQQNVRIADLKARIERLKKSRDRMKKSRDLAVQREQVLRQRIDVRITSGMARRVRRVTKRG